MAPHRSQARLGEDPAEPDRPATMPLRGGTCGHPGPFSLYERANKLVWKLLMYLIIAAAIAAYFAYQLNWRFR